ncbi:MAG: riboflavin synthase subunit beta [Flavobacteriales bacterium CG_4_9_14_3_um_filter_40_17]|nr:MAG: riboflavin synthase subunit beta [Flavobacteriales bacterium CG_4_9_14_3_um_filter_40_17]
MGIFKARKSKEFNYNPRYYKGEGKPFKIRHLFDDNRKTIQKANLKTKIKNAWEDFKSSKDKGTNRRFLFILLILILLFLIFIEFDLTIFLPKN